MASTLRSEPVRRSRAEDVYEQLKLDIAEFRLLPGDRFSENALCDQLAVSRTPIRQALTRLQQEGYVEVLFRSGWRVLPFDFVRFEQLYDLRTILETAAVQRLCVGTQAIASDLFDELMARWLVPAADQSLDAVQVARWDEDFHCALVAAVGNTEMTRLHRDITERIRIVRRLDFTQAARIAVTYEEHGKILNAIRARRVDTATMLLRAHIGTSQAEVRKITLHQMHRARGGQCSAEGAAPAMSSGDKVQPQ
jgi:DNA-binding GntR family transcriptional regulator